MNYKENQELFYVNPFIFKIEKVIITFQVREDNGDIHWIDHSGAYLKEWDLVDNLESAKILAQHYLENFYFKKLNEIIYSNPQLNLEEGE